MRLCREWTLHDTPDCILDLRGIWRLLMMLWQMKSFANSRLLCMCLVFFPSAPTLGPYTLMHNAQLSLVAQEGIIPPEHCACIVPIAYLACQRLYWGCTSPASSVRRLRYNIAVSRVPGNALHIVAVLCEASLPIALLHVPHNANILDRARQQG